MSKKIVYLKHGHFQPERGDQFRPEDPGQFAPEKGGFLIRIIHNELILDPKKNIPPIIIPNTKMNRNQIKVEDQFETYRIQKKLQTRSKNILSRLYYNLKNLGFELNINEGIIRVSSKAVRFRKEIYLKEKESYSFKTDKYGWNERSSQYSGVLELKVKEIWTRDYIDKPNNSLEEQIPKILAFIMACYQDNVEQELIHKKRKFKELKKKQELRQHQKSITLEIKKSDDFLLDAKKWENFNVMKSYLDEIKRLKSIGKNVKSEEWIIWAEKYLDEYNIFGS